MADPSAYLTGVLRQYRIIRQERFASKFCALIRRGFAAILSYCKKSQRNQGEKFPQSAAALIMRCCPSSAECNNIPVFEYGTNEPDSVPLLPVRRAVILGGALIRESGAESPCRWSSHSDLCKFAYVDYNHVRPHSFNGYRTPYEARISTEP